MPSPTENVLAIEMLGRSDAFLQCSERIARAAGVDRPVLVVGERGTGKELAAARLHYLSRRWQNPLVTLNCASLAPALLESELFGHEAGAFTGAVSRRIGRFEAADRGTLFLDELATMPLRAQEKVLRVVEYGEFERLGGMRTVGVDVRIIAATNADLPALCDKGRFKRDLLDRLSFEVITLPPLREREGDAMLLAERFAASMALELEMEEAPTFTPYAVAQIEGHTWPGNIRELKNAVERAVFHAGTEHATKVEKLVLDPFASAYRPLPVQQKSFTSGEPSAPAAKPAQEAPSSQSPTLPMDLGAAQKRLERDALQAALNTAHHNQRAASDLLGLSYHQFRGLYRKYKGELEGADIL